MIESDGSVRFSIKGHDFRIVPFEAFTALDKFGDLQGKLFGPVVAVIGALMQGRQREVSDADIANVTNELKAFSLSMNGAQLKTLFNMLIDSDHVGVRVNGEGDFVKFSTPMLPALGLRSSDLFVMMYHSVEVNYADFLELLRNRIGLDPSELKNKLGSFLPS